MIIRVCVGSSCYIKGAPKIVELFQNKITENGLDDEITLVGSFCTGNCNRVGVTIAVDDEIFTCITPEKFSDFWNEHIAPKLAKQ